MKNKINAWKKAISGWVFLSHSSFDIEKVKIIRNYLEEYQFNAIMFFLKCFENGEDNKKEIEKLLKCEIKSRNIFIFCQSENSKKSKWVNWEREIAKKEDKIYLEIDVEKLDYQKCIELSKIDLLIRYSTLYFIYYSSKKEIIEELEKKLEGFKILKNSENLKKEKEIKKVKQAIAETKNKGFVILFVSEDSKKKKEFWTEKQIALDKDVRIIVVLMDDITIEDFPALKKYKYFIYGKNTNVEKLSNQIYSYIKNEFEKELESLKGINNENLVGENS